MASQANRLSFEGCTETAVAPSKQFFEMGGFKIKLFHVIYHNFCKISFKFRRKKVEEETLGVFPKSKKYLKMCDGSQFFFFFFTKTF